MRVQAVTLAVTALGTSLGTEALAAVMLGVGTAMVYAPLLAVIGDVAHPAWRALGRRLPLRRDGGSALGTLLPGALADAYGIRTAIRVIAALTAASGLLVAGRMYETHRPASATEQSLAVACHRRAQLPPDAQRQTRATQREPIPQAKGLT